MKRFLALTLALALMLSLAPSVFAADTGWEWALEEKTFVYEFNSNAHSGTNTTAGSKNYVQSVVQTIATAKEGYCKWGFVNMRNDTAFPYTDTTHMILTPRMNHNGPVYDPGEVMNGKLTGTIWRSAYAFELDIEESGTYLPTIDYTTYKNSPTVDIYLIEKPTDGDETLNWHTNGNNTSVIQHYAWSLPSTARIGKSIDMQNASSVNRSTELLPVELDASKNYYLFIIPVGITNNPTTSNDIFTDARIFLRSLTLSQRLPQETETLSYVLKVGSLNSKLPRSTDTVNGIWNGTTTWNFNYFDWNTTAQLVADATAEKGVATDESIEPYKTLNLGKTAPFKIDSRASGLNNAKVDTSHFVTGLTTTYYTKDSIASRPHLALRLKVPYAGRYKLELAKNGGTTRADSAFMKVYFGKADNGAYNATNVQTKITSGDYAHLGWYNYYEGMYTKETTPENKVSSDYYTVDIPSAGEYHLVFDACSESLDFNSYSGTQFFRFYQVNLIPVPGVLSEAEVKVQTIANTMTADIAVESADAAPTTATVNVLTRDIEGNADASAVVTTISEDVGSTLTATAPEKDGYEFLYWEKGIGSERRAVYYEPKYSFKATSGGMWLTAVYRNASSEALPVIFYNATGDELSRAFCNSGDEITAPSAPAFENYAFIGWKCAETGDVYASGDAIIAEGKQMRIVAQYEDVQTPSIVVSVTGGTGAGTYTYGDTVTVSATEREGGNGSKLFCYWTKNGEIVSFDKTYTFLASKNCNLIAVYEDYKPTVSEKLRRIIISGNFAEFIGLDNASEMGILFNENGENVTFANATHKIAVTGDGNQLKFDNDLGEDSTMTGYAIVDGKVIYSK